MERGGTLWLNESCIWNEFDFGNVLAKFDTDKIVRIYCPEDNDFKIIKDKLFYDWDLLDSGRIAYEDYMNNVASMLPKHLIPAFRQIENEWYMHLDPIKETWALIHELKENGYKVYVLSNAPTFFAEHANYFSITKESWSSIYGRFSFNKFF